MRIFITRRRFLSRRGKSFVVSIEHGVIVLFRSPMDLAEPMCITFAYAYSSLPPIEKHIAH